MNTIDSKDFFHFFNACAELYIKSDDRLTVIQQKDKYERLKNSLLEKGNNFLYKDMTMEGYIENIGEGAIFIRRWNTWNELVVEYPINIENDCVLRMVNFYFYYKPETFKNELMTYNLHDYVKITGNIHFLFNRKGGLSEIGIKKDNESINEHSGKYSVYLDLIAIEKIKKPTTESSSTSCFIATACYGDYNATEVLELRYYRDSVLLKTNLGRILVDIYYFISPPIAKFLEKSESLKAFVRKNILAPIIKKIKYNHK